MKIKTMSWLVAAFVLTNVSLQGAPNNAPNNNKQIAAEQIRQSVIGDGGEHIAQIGQAMTEVFQGQQGDHILVDEFDQFFFPDGCDDFDATGDNVTFKNSVYGKTCCILVQFTYAGFLFACEFYSVEDAVGCQSLLKVVLHSGGQTLWTWNNPMVFEQE